MMRKDTAFQPDVHLYFTRRPCASIIIIFPSQVKKGEHHRAAQPTVLGLVRQQSSFENTLLEI